jgi:hypothetical protein
MIERGVCSQPRDLDRHVVTGAFFDRARLIVDVPGERVFLPTFAADRVEHRRIEMAHDDEAVRIEDAVELRRGGVYGAAPRVVPVDLEHVRVCDEEDRRSDPDARDDVRTRRRRGRSKPLDDVVGGASHEQRRERQPGKQVVVDALDVDDDDRVRDEARRPRAEQRRASAR